VVHCFAGKRNKSDNCCTSGAVLSSNVRVLSTVASTRPGDFAASFRPLHPHALVVSLHSPSRRRRRGRLHGNCVVVVAFVVVVVVIVFVVVVVVVV
jgi:hypothetical protein